MAQMPLLKIVTYNILANDSLSSFLYSYVNDPAILSREYRRPRLLSAALTQGRVDIVCLQEFDDVQYWNVEMMSRGYAGYYVLRHERNSGCAIFWDSSKYHFLEKWPINFNDMLSDPSPVIQANPGKFKRDNAGLIVLLRSLETGKLLCVATAHLYWDPRMEDVKIHQARWMTTALKRIVSERGNVPWILAGDFNSTPDSDVYRYMTNEELGKDDEHKVGKVPLPAIKSAYGKWKEPKFTTYTKDFKACIDYIFYDSEHFSVSDLVLPDESGFNDVVAIPSHDHPSDHLPVYAGFCCIDKTPVPNRS